MSETTTIILPDAAKLDGTEHIEISQQGNRRRTLLSDIANLTPTALVLPTADPHVVNAIWNNAGTVTVSGG